MKESCTLLYAEPEAVKTNWLVAMGPFQTWIIVVLVLIVNLQNLICRHKSLNTKPFSFSMTIFVELISKISSIIIKISNKNRITAQMLFSPLSFHEISKQKKVIKKNIYKKYMLVSLSIYLPPLLFPSSFHTLSIDPFFHQSPNLLLLTHSPFSQPLPNSAVLYLPIQCTLL